MNIASITTCTLCVLRTNLSNVLLLHLHLIHLVLLTAWISLLVDYKFLHFQHPKLDPQ
jgi:hypothetical protein